MFACSKSGADSVSWRRHSSGPAVIVSQFLFFNFLRSIFFIMSESPESNALDAKNQSRELTQVNASGAKRIFNDKVELFIQLESPR